MPKPYQKIYPPHEIQELLQWFTDRLDRLPPSLDMGKRGNIPDLRRTVKLYLEFVVLCHEKPAYSGQILHLFHIREHLEAEGFQ